LLDEPFGALDALTRGNLQEQLMKICEENQVTGVMVTTMWMKLCCLTGL